MCRLAKYSLLLPLVLILPVKGFGQTDNQSRYTINLGLGIEKVGIPFRRVIDFPMHSSYHLGVSRKWSKLSDKPGFQDLVLNVFTNTSAGSGYMLHTAYGVRVKILKNLYLSPSAGIGLIHLFRPKESFTLNNGIYQLSADQGHLFPEASMSLTLVYQRNKIGLFGSYQMGVQTGYNDDIKVLPRTFLTIGVMYAIL